MTQDREWHPDPSRDTTHWDLEGGTLTSPAFEERPVEAHHIDPQGHDMFGAQGGGFDPGGGFMADDMPDDMAAIFERDQAAMQEVDTAPEGDADYGFGDSAHSDDLFTHQDASHPAANPYVAARASHAVEPESWFVRNKKIVAGAALAAVLLGGGGAAAMSLGDGSDSKQPTVASSQTTATAVANLTRPAPVGWSRTPVWSKPVSVMSNVAVRGNTIAYLTASGSMEVRNGSGDTLASSEPTEFSQGAVVGVVKLDDGQEAVVASQGGRAAIWVLSTMGQGGEHHQVNIPDGANVSWGSGGLLVSQGNRGWSVGSDAKLHELKIPSGYSPMGVLPDGQAVIAKPGDGWKLLGHDGKTKDVSAKAPEGTKGGMNVAWTANGVMVAWGKTSTDEKRSIGFYDVRTGKLRASGTMDTVEVNRGLPLAVSSDGARASAGSLLANLDDGTTMYVSGWQAISADNTALYGGVSGTNKKWDGSGSPSDLVANTAIPWGSLDNSNVVVVDLNSIGQQSLVALRRPST